MNPHQPIWVLCTFFTCGCTKWKLTIITPSQKKTLNSSEPSSRPSRPCAPPGFTDPPTPPRPPTGLAWRRTRPGRRTRTPDSRGRGRGRRTRRLEEGGQDLPDRRGTGRGFGPVPARGRFWGGRGEGRGNRMFLWLFHVSVCFLGMAEPEALVEKDPIWGESHPGEVVCSSF